MLWPGCNRRWSVGVCEWRLTKFFLPYRIASLPHLLSCPSAHEATSPQFTCVSIFVPPHTISSCNPSKTISHHISPHHITSLTIAPLPKHIQIQTHTLQVTYAALDAAVLLKLFDCLLSSPASALSSVRNLFDKVSRCTVRCMFLSNAASTIRDTAQSF